MPWVSANIRPLGSFVWVLTTSGGSGHSSGKVPGWFGGRFQSFWERDRLGSPKQHQLGEWFKFCPQQNLAVGDIPWASKSNIRIPWEWGQRPCEGCKLWHWGLGCGPRLLHISSRHRVSTTDTVRCYRYDLMCISVFYICIIYKHTHTQIAESDTIKWDHYDGFWLLPIWQVLLFQSGLVWIFFVDARFFLRCCVLDQSRTIGWLLDICLFFLVLYAEIW